MAHSESELIERYFSHLGAVRADVALGIGDDAALLQPPIGTQLVLTTDALIEGVHFLPQASPRSLGHRALAVNLSDIAAMGAEPLWALLSLNLPQAEERWLQGFADGFGALARHFGVALVGGNLSRGALSITVTLAGAVAPGQALRRDGARVGDAMYVSGTVGDAAEGLASLAQAPNADNAFVRERFEFPSPRVRLGPALAGIVSACIDVSDGLYADALQLLNASRCAAQLQVGQLPLSPALRHRRGADAWQCALRGGEDYELCFTAAPGEAQAVAQAALRADTPVTCIGTLTAGQGVTLLDGNSVMQFSALGFDHFRGQRFT